MRTVTFSNPGVSSLLGEKFVCAWKNQRPQRKFVDERNQRFPQNCRLPNGIGASNVTSIFAAADGTVLHAMPGMLDAVSFLRHVEFALDLHAQLQAEGVTDDRCAQIISQAHRDATPKDDARGIERGAHRLLQNNMLTVDTFPSKFFQGLDRSDMSCGVGSRTR